MKNTILLFSIFSLLIKLSTAQNISINEERFISLGGIEQWITIHGKDRSKPVVLFVHGGPGSTMSQYNNMMYKQWEDDFVLVNWDQRGAGRTYGRNIPVGADETYWIENPLTVKQMTQDGIALAQYLIQLLNKEKLILIGTSWGSILGTEMALSNPELFYAYVGHAQFVNFSENIDYAYLTVYEMVKNSNDMDSLKKLESLGKPPYTSAKNYGQLLRVIKKYERENSTPAPTTWFGLAPEYDNEKDSKHRYDGDDYSFVHFVGHHKLGIKSMVSDIDFKISGTEFKIPVYLIQGENDILTAKEVNKPYFDKIVAPDKTYFLVTNAAHGHNQSVVERQYEVVKNLISHE
ncbi:alpha/beta fold hydrolase [Ulvibacterium sp.]|uniref:alpha/beta fold hydrolase n=1 Tax=Ulvibacterium sp. TaxID=2665914 RepID=UPI0026192EEB|nr:alpha/beta fold hydrolase [Ulvibacterium sp.]